MQSDDHGYAAYIIDLVDLLRDRAEEAKRASKLDPGGTDFQEGRLMAYIEVLSLMQNQADAFMIPRETLGLGGFDPENEEFQSIPPGKVRGTSL